MLKQLLKAPEMRRGIDATVFLQFRVRVWGVG